MLSHLLIVLAVLFFVLAALDSHTASACTTFGVGKSATVDGSVMSVHTNDGGGTTDPRLVKVAARDHAPGSKRAIYASPENYPRYVGYERDIEEYFPENCQAGDLFCKPFEPIGFIPEVPHTFGYFEQTYGAINEHQVGISESTCSSVFVASAVNNNGKALFSIDQLSQIAMERATTARSAISIMGSLAEQFGFYGESTSFEGGGESLIVTDPEEAWVFHILADPTGVSAIWAAQRIPDDSVAIVANMYVIGVVDLNDTANFMGRSDMWEVAASAGVYTEGNPKDFTKTFSDGEYSHKFYSGRRVWGVYRLFSPSLNLSPDYNDLKEDKPYPFSGKAEKKLTLHDVRSALRDWYNGTEFSTTQEGDLAGGAFSSPDRYSLSWTLDAGVTGAWERTIALFRSSDTQIIQSRGWLPAAIGGIIWYGPHAAHGTVYTPCMVGMSESPGTLAFGWQGVYNLSTTFWANRIVLNLAQIKFSYMIEDIRVTQDSLEAASEALVTELSNKFASSGSNFSTEDIALITDTLAQNADFGRETYLKLFNNMLFKYNDGFFNYWDPKTGKFKSTSLGYPVWWLNAVGYSNGPPPVDLSSNPELAQDREDFASLSAAATSTFSHIGSSLSGKLESKGATTLRECIVSKCSGVKADSKHRSCVSMCMSNSPL